MMYLGLVAVLVNSPSAASSQLQHFSSPFSLLFLLLFCSLTAFSSSASFHSQILQHVISNAHSFLSKSWFQVLLSVQEEPKLQIKYLMN